VFEAYRDVNELNWSLRWRGQLVQPGGAGSGGGVRTPALSEIEKARFRKTWLAVRRAQAALVQLDVNEAKAVATRRTTAFVEGELWPQYQPSADEPPSND